MKRSSKRLLSMLLAVIMVIGLAVPAMAVTFSMDEVAEVPVGETPAAEAYVDEAPVAKASAADSVQAEPVAELAALDIQGANTAENNETGVFVLDAMDNSQFKNSTGDAAEDATGFQTGGIGEDYFTFTGKVKRKFDKSTPKNMNGVEVGSKESTTIDFTVTGTATVKIVWANGSGGKSSVLGLKKGSDLVAISSAVKAPDRVVGTEAAGDLAADQTLGYVCGGAAAAVEYTWTGLEAGSYKVVAPTVAFADVPATIGGNAVAEGTDTDPTAKGTRVYSVVVDQTVSGGSASGSTTTNVYVFDATKIPDGASAADPTKAEDKIAVTKAELQNATTKNGEALTEEYMNIFVTEKTSSKDEKVVGKVIKRNTAKKDAEPTASIKGVEIEKIGTGGLDFTVEGTAEVTLNVCSTGADNVSMMNIIKLSDNSIQPATMVTAGQGVDSDKNPVAGHVSAVADGKATHDDMVPAEGVVVAWGNNAKPTTVSYTLSAGDYRITSYEDFTGRAFWILDATISDTVAAGKSVTDSYVFDVTKIPDGASAADPTKAEDKIAVTKAELQNATTKNGEALTEEYMSIFTTEKTSSKDEKVVGKVIKRNTAKKDAEPTASIKGIEIEKIGTGGLDFTVQGTAEVTLDVCSTGADNVSMMNIIKLSDNSIQPATMVTAGQGVDSDKNPVAGHVSAVADGKATHDDMVPAEGVVVVWGNNAKATTVSYTLSAGDYRITSYEDFTGRAFWILGATINDTYMSGGGKTTRVTAPWTVEGIGAATATPEVKGGKIEITVGGSKVGKVTVNTETGKTVTTYADSLLVTMYNAAGVSIGSSPVMNQKASFQPSASGKYTFKVFAVREGEANLETGNFTTPIDFTLPLAKASIASAASNGKEDGKDTASVNLMWAKVPEATTYNVRVKEHTAAEWPAAVKVDATAASNMIYVVTGLSVGTAYDFQVQAMRGDEASDWSDVFEGDPVSATQQFGWTERVFGTSTTDTANCVVGPDTKFNTVGNGKETISAADGTYSVQFKNADGTDKGEPRVIEGLTGDINSEPNKRVLLSSRDGAGKITEQSSDGLLFYYTAIPAGVNYTLEANVEVLRWATRDTQNGVGLAALDRVPEASWTGSSAGNSGNFWNNSYMGGAARLSFAFDRKDDGSEGGNTYAAVDMGYDAATKYSYYMGPLSIAKNGIPMTANGPWNESSNPANFYERRFPLDTRLAADGRTVKVGGNTNRFNLIGNYTVQPAGFSQMHEGGEIMAKYELTKMKVRLQKNNDGYITTMWDDKGNLLGQNTEYFVKGAMDLSGTEPYHTGEDGIHLADATGRKDVPELQQCLDSDYEYVGLFTSRDLDALFTDVTLTTVPAEQDAPAQTPPITKITPSMSVSSGDYSNSADFNVAVSVNVEGAITVVQNGKSLTDEAGNVKTFYAKANANGVIERVDIPVVLKEGTNNFKVTFTPDVGQALPPYTELGNTDPIDKTFRVTYQTRFAGMYNLYVAPGSTALLGSNNGTREYPLDVYTAVSVVKPGQNIILLEGTYLLSKPIRINRGMDGTKENPIYFVAEPGAKVVLNGQGSSGSVLVHGSNWWVFKDFEVVGSSNGSTAFQLSGSNNIVQNVSCHDNGSTGLQVSRLSNSDHIPDRSNANVGELDEVEGITDWGDWPCNNLIVNCSSYRNYDTGYNGADGFGAKLTVGEGNVFDGCVAYWNADDGWDLYAKTSDEEGPIGRVTLRNCITFENGYEVRVLADVGAQKPALDPVLNDGYTPLLDRDDEGNIKLSPAGNGNGFKLGGSHLPGKHSITNSFAFYNACKGFDSNNGPDIQISGCTGYNNGEENVGLSSKYKTYDYLVEKTVSFKDDKAPEGHDGQIKMKDGTPEGGTSVYNYYQWDGTASKGVGTVSGTITADSFVSLDWDNSAWAYGPQRDADGSLALGDFLKLKDTVTDAGAGELVNDPSSAPVGNPANVVNPPEETAAPSVGGGSGGGGGIGGGSSSTGVGVDKLDKDPVQSGDDQITIDPNKPASENFSDVEKDSWYEAGVTYVVKKGLFQGIAQGVFAPQQNMTRAMLVTVLARLDGQNTEGGDTWFAKGAAWAVAQGVSDGTMLEQNVTREQMVTMLYRYAKATATEADMAAFVDTDSVSDYATEAMAWAVANGIITGKDGARLDPQGTATRAEVATILQRFVEKFEK